MRWWQLLVQKCNESKDRTFGMEMKMKIFLIARLGGGTRRRHRSTLIALHTLQAERDDGREFYKNSIKINNLARGMLRPSRETVLEIHLMSELIVPRIHGSINCKYIESNQSRYNG